MPSQQTLSIIDALEKNWQNIVEVITAISQTTIPQDKVNLYRKLLELTSQASFSTSNIIVATDFIILGHEYKNGSELTGLIKKQISGKVNLTDDNFDIFRELSLFQKHADSIVRFKKMLQVKRIMGHIAQYCPNPLDDLHFFTRQLAALSSLGLLDEIVEEYSRHHGFQLERQSLDAKDVNVCYKCDAFAISCDPNENEGGRQLLKIALQETTPFVARKSLFCLPPLLYLNYNLLQSQEPNQYEDAINVVIKNHADRSLFALLSTTDISFFQTPLSNAIGMDNTNAAIAFINVITSSTLSDENKKALINHCSRFNARKNNAFFTAVDSALYSATPLLLAIQRGNRRVVDLLCANPHLDPNRADANGLTPLDWAFIMAEPEIISKLLTLGAKPERSSCFDENTKTFSIDRTGPQNKQIYAHFWNHTDEFYLYRSANPAVEKCEKLLNAYYIRKHAPSP